MNEPSIAIARIARVRGLRGELLVTLFNPDSATLRPGLRITLQPLAPEHKLVERTIQGIEGTGPHRRLRLEGLSDREEAGKLVGALVLVERDQLPSLAADEWYWKDLVGLTVVGNHGRRLGTVESLYHPGSHLIYVLKTEGGSVELPAVPAYIAAVDPPGGLLELTEEGEVYVLGYPSA
ncbi:MAG: 16S rRNA processing protein RimM [Deltaproteobacteria bacterium RIFOXYA12_FULL_61_11]|nr:MAG: 16S rRNA processing protein RimM [Deltaproteobacteria bacterium RIFOXYA12_FULL_61_11]